MKKAYFAMVMVLLLALALTGCFKTQDPIQVVLQKGDLSVSLDFSTLDQVISRVTLLATNPSYDPITQDLYLNGKVAEGFLVGLAEGTWHIRIEVFDDLSNMIYFGESDVSITAGTTFSCEFVFEQTPTPNQTGDLQISLIIKDFPGHVLIPHNVDQIVQGQVQKNLYILDRYKKQITIYDSLNYTKMHQYTVPEDPSLIGISPDETKIWVVFTSGHIGTLDIPSGVLTIRFWDYYNVKDLLCFTDTLVVRLESPGLSSIFISLDLMDGTFNDTFNMPYVDMDISAMEYNPLSGRIYYLTNNHTDPFEIHSFPYDPLTGSFGAAHTVSGYHADTVGPLRFINGNTILVTPNGSTYRCEMDDMNDLALQSGMPYHYWDLAVDPMSQNMFAINRYEYMADPSQIVLNVLDQVNYFHWDTIPLEGNPKQIYMNTDSSMTLLVEKDMAWYFRRIHWPVI